MADKRKQIVLNEILQLIGSIKEHADDLEWNNHIPQIELEFISSKIAKLYEKSIVLNFLNTFEDDLLSTKKAESHSVINTTGIIESIKVENDVQEISPETNPNTSIDIISSVIQEIIENVEIENKQEFIDNTLLDSSETESMFINIHDSNITETIPVVSKQQDEIITEPVKTKHEENSESILKKITDPKRPPIPNLKSAISINQRLQFINNLFKGNAELMNQSIEELNNLDTIDEASAKLEELINKLGWDKDYELYLGFKELVERRYS